MQYYTPYLLELKHIFGATQHFRKKFDGARVTNALFLDFFI
jgi:hypothetical protein